jgi:hypothetical protein
VSFFEQQASKSKAAAEVKDRYDFAAESILSDLYTVQRNAVLDPNTRKSVLTPRRAGKTHTAIAYALFTACTSPGCRVPIITLTLKSAKSLYWIPLKEMADKYGLNVKFSFSENTATFENGSIVRLHGAETKADIEKLRGGAYKLVLIDECKSFNVNLFQELVQEILMPATQDTSGTIMIIGTPGHVLDGPFYEATYPGLTDDEGRLITRDFYKPEKYWDDPNHIPRYSRHHWTVEQNELHPDIWQNALLDKKRMHWADNNPIWVRESLGQWVASEETQVYALQTLVRKAGGAHAADCVYKQDRSAPGANKHGLPAKYGWNYVLGVDFGFEDDFAVVVVAYSEHYNQMLLVAERAFQHLTVPGMASVIDEVVEEFDGNIESMIADSGGLGKALMESMNEMYGYHFEAAKKTDKFDFIELLNSDLHSGRLKIPQNSKTYDEMYALQFALGGKTKAQCIRLGKLKENPSMPNHLCDALLYTWRFCYHHFYTEAPVHAEVATPEWFLEMDQREAEEAVTARDAVSTDLGEWTDEIQDLDDMSSILMGDDYF